MFLQQLYDSSIPKFLKAGKDILNSTNIRSSFKYLFIEVLSQANPDIQEIRECVMELLSDLTWQNSVIKTIISGSKYYVHLLRDEGILDEWINNPQTQTLAIVILLSIDSEFDDNDVIFIRKYIYSIGTIDDWNRFFYRDINEDIDTFFELRMEVYEKNPRLIDNFFYVKEMMQQCEIRTVRLLSLMLKEQMRKRENRIYKYAKEFVCEDLDVFVSDYHNVINYLLPCLPNVDDCIKFTNWIEKKIAIKGLERTCVMLIKLATEKLATKEPEEFFNIFNFAFDKGNALYNEIILDGMYYLDDKYANFVIEYLAKDHFINAIEDTSGNGNKLLLAKRLISRFSELCNDIVLNHFEEKVICFIDKKAKHRYEYRIEMNKQRKSAGVDAVYSPFWGGYPK